MCPGICSLRSPRTLKPQAPDSDAHRLNRPVRSHRVQPFRKLDRNAPLPRVGIPLSSFPAFQRLRAAHAAMCSSASWAPGILICLSLKQFFDDQTTLQYRANAPRQTNSSRLGVARKFCQAAPVFPSSPGEITSVCYVQTSLFLRAARNPDRPGRLELVTENRPGDFSHEDVAVGSNRHPMRSD
jgi:hypothetical protein